MLFGQHIARIAEKVHATCHKGLWLTLWVWAWHTGQGNALLAQQPAGTYASVANKPLLQEAKTVQLRARHVPAGVPPQTTKAAKPQTIEVFSNIFEAPAPTLTTYGGKLPLLEPGKQGLAPPARLLLKGEAHTASLPASVPAESPRYRDNALYNIQYMQVDQGLNSAYLRAICQDKMGNIWLGSFGGGLSKFDGERFYHFTQNQGLSNDYVRAISEDRQGHLWIGTWGGGLNEFDGQQFIHYRPENGFPSDIVTSVFTDSKGRLWVGTYGEGLFVWAGEAGQEEGSKLFRGFSEAQGLSSGLVYAITEDRKGNLWVATDGGGLNMLSMQPGDTALTITHITRQHGLSDDELLCVLEDRQGNIWAGTRKGGLNKLYMQQYDGSLPLNIAHIEPKNSLMQYEIRALVEDEAGTLWLGTWGGGMLSYDGSHFTRFDERVGLSDNRIWCMLRDASDNIWIGTDGGGLNKYKGNSFRYYTQHEGFSSYYIYDIIEENGHLWLATYGGGVYRFDGKKLQVYTTQNGLSENRVRTILTDSRGNKWLGTWGGGLCKFDGSTFSCFTTEQGLPDNRVSSIVEDQQGQLWIGTFGGLCSFDGQQFTTYSSEEGPEGKEIYCLLTAGPGQLWIGTEGNGFYRLSGYNGPTQSLTHFTLAQHTVGNTVYVMRQDKRGRLWLGTDDGLGCFDGTQYHPLTPHLPLLGNARVHSLQQDADGNLWVATEKGLHFLLFEGGLSAWEPGMQPIVYSYDKNDGLKELDFVTDNVCMDSKGRIWWGNGKNLLLLDVNTFEHSTSVPSVQLTELRLNNQYLDFRQLPDSLQGLIQFSGTEPFSGIPRELRLPYTYRHLIFYFSAIDWAAQDNIQYAYRMRGMTEQWTRPGPESKAEYRNMPYGDFTFEVKAKGEAGKWSQPLAYTFTISPPWWQSWWAYCLYAAGAFLLIFGYVKWRTHRLREVQKILTKSEEKYRELVEQASDGIFVFDLQGYFLQTNTSASLLTGYSKEEFQHLHLKDIIAPDDLQMKPLKLRELAQGEHLLFERAIKRKDGSLFEAEISAKLLPNGHAQAIMRDISRRKKAEKRENLRTRVLEQLSTGMPLRHILTTIVKGAEAYNPGSFCSILLLDKQGKIFSRGIAPSLPEFYNQALIGLQIGEGVGSCGTTAATGQRVIAYDIHTHPYWVNYRELADRAGLRACWSEPIKDSKGNILGSFAIYHPHPAQPGPDDIEFIRQLSDLTAVVLERFQAAAALKESEELYRTLSYISEGAIWEENLITGESKRVNDGLHRIFGYPPEVELSYDWWIQHVHPDDVERVHASYQKAISSRTRIWKKNYRFFSYTGEIKYIEDSAIILYDEQDKPYRVIGSMHDITYKVEAQKAQLRSLIMGEENERKRLAAELHDSLGQILSLISLNLGSLPPLEGSHAVTAQKKISASLHMINQSIEEIRAISHGLMPRSLEDFGLQAVLEGMVKRVQQVSNASIHYHQQAPDARYDPNIEINVYRIVQEALNNALRHAEAQNIYLSIKEVQQKLIVECRDDGSGFDLQAVQQLTTSNGLKNIANRVDAIDGSLHIQTAPGQGTSIRIEVLI